MKQEFGQTCDWIKKRLGDKVASVQISNRLSSSPCVLVSGKFGWSANMERCVVFSNIKWCILKVWVAMFSMLSNLLQVDEGTIYGWCIQFGIHEEQKGVWDQPWPFYYQELGCTINGESPLLFFVMITNWNYGNVILMDNFQDAFKTNPDDEDALRAIDLLYDAALVSSGFTVNSWLHISECHLSFHCEILNLYLLVVCWCAAW